jgi:hypothetical protein
MFGMKIYPATLPQLIRVFLYSVPETVGLNKLQIKKTLVDPLSKEDGYSGAAPDSAAVKSWIYLLGSQSFETVSRFMPPNLTIIFNLIRVLTACSRVSACKSNKTDGNKQVCDVLCTCVYTCTYDQNSVYWALKRTKYHKSMRGKSILRRQTQFYVRHSQPLQMQIKCNVQTS